MGPKQSYKYDLTNLLVPLIMLSLNHQNHKQWPKWGHVPYSRAPRAAATRGLLVLEEGAHRRWGGGEEHWRAAWGGG